ncbi:MAG: hypothetical protein Q9160_004351 [Pyrenula sp. 1 TL-2023]
MGDQTSARRSRRRIDLLALAPTPAQIVARNKHRIKARTNTDASVLKTCPYESTQAGNPPVMGGVPKKGNGPVRLQHNVRLSSGELLVTDEANERILDDIRRGDYIVGRKERKGPSQPSKACSVDNLSKPAPLTTAWERETHSLPQTPFPRNDSAFENSPRSLAPSAESVRQGDVYTFGLPHSLSSSHLESSRAPESKRSSTRASGSGHDGEGNNLIQALWKAEYNHLVALRQQSYGTTPNSSPHLEDDCRPSSRDMPYIEGHCSSDLQAYHHSPSIRDLSLGDASSSYSSPTEHSGASSHRTNSTCTGRTSFQPDPPGTRDDVRRMIEDMRTMYLSAIESRSASPSPNSSNHNVDNRASVGNPVAPQPVRVPRPPQKSWHAGSPSSSVSRSRAEKKRKSTAPKGRSASPKEKNRQPPKDQDPSPQKSPAQASMKRADSLTLGSIPGAMATPTKLPPLVTSPYATPTSPTSPTTPRAMRQDKPLPPTPCDDDDLYNSI